MKYKMSSYFKLGGFYSRGGVPQEKSEHGVKITISGPCRLCGKRIQKTKAFYEQVDRSDSINEREILERCRNRALEWGRKYIALHEKCANRTVRYYAISRPTSSQYYCLKEDEVWTVYEDDLEEQSISEAPIEWLDMKDKLIKAELGDVLELDFFNVEIREMKAKEYFALPEFCGW